PVLLLVVLAFLLAGCFGVSPGVGRIAVTSEPDGAKIFLDGKDTGQVTPATLSNVPVGTHQIQLELAGYEPETRSATVQRNATVAISVTLKPLAQQPPGEDPGDPGEEPDPQQPPGEDPGDPGEEPDPSHARVYGFVTASTGGQRVPGATVTAYVSGTSEAVASTATDESGAYVLYLPAGTYDIVADKPGHAQAKRQALFLDVAGEAKV